jgi:hypothetical protein
MKKLLFVSVALLCVFSLNAQKVHLKAISFGLMVPVYGIAPVPFQEKPFNLGYDLAPSVNLITNKTHHHLRYGVGSNSIQLINGYFFKNDWDVYNFYSNNLNSQGQYLGFGVTKVSNSRVATQYTNTVSDSVPTMYTNASF